MYYSRKLRGFSLVALLIAVPSLAFADTVVTSQAYVDMQDATKVSIAQGTGTNNANVGKTLVVNSSGNLELGTVAGLLPSGTSNQVLQHNGTNWTSTTMDTTPTASSNKPVTSGGVKTYADSKVSSSATISDTATATAPNEKAVYDALAGKQSNIGGTGNGDKAVIATTTAGTVNYKTIKTSVDSSSDLITAGAVKTYADSKISADATISSTSTTTAPNEKAVYDALASANSAIGSILNTQIEDNDTTHAPDGNAVYDALAGKQNNLGGSGNNGKAVIATDTAGTVNYKTIKTAVDSSSDLITAGAVKTYADSKVSTSTTVSSTDSTTAPNQKAVYDALNDKQTKPSSDVANGKVLTYTGTDANADVSAAYVNIPVSSGAPSTNTPSSFAEVWIQ